MPTIKYRVLPHIPNTPATRTLLPELDHINTQLSRNFTPGNKLFYTQYLFLLRNEYQKEYINLWNNLLEKASSTDDAEIFWKSIKRMMGTKQQDPNNALLNENGIPLEGDRILEGFARRFERTFKISDAENEDFDRTNEIMVNTHIRNNQNKIALGLRRDINCNYSRGGDTKIHTHEIIKEIHSLKNKAPGISGINK